MVEEYEGGAAPPVLSPQRRDNTPPGTHEAHTPAPHEPTQTNNPRRHQTKDKKTVKAHVKIGTQNINGRTFHTKKGGSRSIWPEINRAIREQRLGILAIQESHLTEADLAETQQRYGKSLSMENSPLPENPSGSAGVAFILNKALIRTDDFSTTEVIPGRALILRINWNGREELTLLNVYAPNHPNLHPPFWALLTSELNRLGITDIDYALGDTNVAEDARDRSPPHPDDERAVTALKDFRREFGLLDAWRDTYPRTKAFTYRHNRGATKSRIDRIYTSERRAREAYEWSFTPKAIPSDHDLVAVKHAMGDAPEIGEGRWTLPLFLTTDKSMLDKLETLGIELQSKLDGAFPDREKENPQKLWYHFKWKVQDIGRETAGLSINRINSKLKTLRQNLIIITRNKDFDKDEDLRVTEALIVQEIDHLERKRRSASQRAAQARWQVKGESVGKYWSRAN
ncbi:DNase I-like protein, partial [Auriscalpium vulgare]